MFQTRWLQSKSPENHGFRQDLPKIGSQKIAILQCRFLDIKAHFSRTIDENLSLAYADSRHHQPAKERSTSQKTGFGQLRRRAAPLKCEYNTNRGRKSQILRRKGRG